MIRSYIYDSIHHTRINYHRDFFTKLAQAKFVVVNAILSKLYKRKSRKELHRVAPDPLDERALIDGGVLGGSEPLPHQLWRLGERCKLPEGSGAKPRKIWILEHFGTSEKSREKGQLA